MTAPYDAERHVALERLVSNELKYRLGDPLAAWDSILFCHAMKIQLPKFVLEYLASCASYLAKAQNSARASGSRDITSEAKLVSEAMGFSSKKGRGNRFTTNKRIQRDVKIYTEIEKRRPKGDTIPIGLYDAVGKEFGLSRDGVKKAHRSMREIAKIVSPELRSTLDEMARKLVSLCVR